MALSVLGLVLVSLIVPFSGTVQAAPSPGINNQINFQGRLLTAAGAVVADGNYNMQFKLYKNGDGLTAGNTTCTIADCASTVGTLQWTEEWLNSASHSVVVKNGYFSVNLGSITTLAGVDLNQPVLWLSMNVAGGANATSSCATPFATNCTPDGEMLPMRRVASAIYAFNAGQLGGLTAAGFIQNTTSQQTANFNILSGAATTVPAAQIQTVASATAPVLLLKGGATPGTGGDLLQLQTSASAIVFRVDSAGILGSADTNAGSTNSAGTTIRTGNATGATSTSGTLAVATGTGTTNTGDITITTGAATGTSGSIAINVGSGGTKGSIGIGNGANVPAAISIGQSGVTTTNGGALTVTGLLTENGGNSISKTFSANSGTTQNVSTLAFTTPADSAGTNVSQGINITPTIGNATAGTNTANIINIGAFTGDAQVSTNVINIGALTGTAAAENAINLGTGWDNAIQSAGAINLTGGAASTFGFGANTLAVTSGNFNVSVGGVANLSTGFQIGGAAANGNYLRGNGTNFVSSAIQSGDIPVCSGTCNYISNGTAQQTANFNIVSAAAGSVGALIQAAASATTPVLAVKGGATPGAGGDLAQFQNSGGTVLTKIDASGNLQVAASIDTQTATALGVGQSTANAINLGNTTSNITTTVNGVALVKPTTGNDSATAFQVQNAAGVAQFVVDTVNGRVGTASTAAASTNSQDFRIRSGDTTGTGTPKSGDILVRSGSSTNGASGSISLEVGAAATTFGDIFIGSAFRANSVNLGSVGTTAIQSTINIATTTGAATQTVNIGSAGGAVANVTNIQAGTSGGINIGTANAAVPLQLGSTTLSAGTQTIGLGNNNTAGGTTNVTIGSGSSAAGGTTTVQAKGAVSIIGGAASSFTILQAAAGGGANLSLTAGQGASGQIGGNLVLKAGANGTAAGTPGSVIVQANAGESTTAFAVQANTGSTNILAVDSSALRVRVGTAGTATGQLYVGGSVPTAAAGSVSTGAASGPYSVAVQGKYAYVITNTTAKIQAYDVSNPASPVALGTSVNTDASGGTASPKGLTVSGRYAYVANEVANTVSIIDISNPAALVRVGAVTTGTAPRSVAVSGRYAYVVNSSSNTIQALDITNPAAPFVISSRATQGTTPRQVIVQGRYAYIASEGTTSRIEIMDVNDPANMVQKGATTTNITATQGAFNLQVQGKYLYLLDYAGKLNVYDISDPTTIGATSTTSSSTITGVNPRAMVVQGRYAYIVTESDNKFIINDISNPASVANVGSFTVGGATKPWWVAVQGRYAYIVTNTTNTLQTIDLGGTYSQQFEAGSIEANSTATIDLAVSRDATITGGLMVGQSLSVTGDVALGNGLYVASNGGTDATLAAASVDTAGSQPFNGGGWSGAGWNLTGTTTAPHTTGTTPLTNTSFTPTVGTTYQVAYTYNSCDTTTNTVTVAMGGTTLDTAAACSAGSVTNTKVFTASTTAQLTFTPTTGYTGTLSAVSIRALTQSNDVLTVTNSSSVATLEVRAGSSTSNLFIGLSAGKSNTSTGTNNTAVGTATLQSNSTGANNSAFGTFALQSNTTGSFNMAIGTSTLASNTTGSHNTAIGYNALQASATVDDNTAIGYKALEISVGGNSTAIGAFALGSNVVGVSNTAIGVSALTNSTVGNGVAVGSNAGRSVTSGTKATFVGKAAGYQDGDGFVTTGTTNNSGAIGFEAQVQQANSLVLGGTGQNAVNIGIGTTAPTNTLSVSPIQYNTGTATRTNTSTTVTPNSGATWTTAMIGSEIIFADGMKRTISNVSGGNITLSSASTVTDGVGVAYRVHYVGFQVKSDGTAYIQATSSAALSVQNAAGTSLVTVGTDGGDDAVYGTTLVDTANSIGGGAVAAFNGGLWTGNIPTDWTATATTATHVTGNVTQLVFTTAPTIGVTYEVGFTYTGCSATAGLGVTMGGQTVDFASNCVGNGTYTNKKIITATATTTLRFTPSTTTYTGTLSAVTVRVISRNSDILTVLNNAGTAVLEVRAGGSNTNAFIGVSSGSANVSSTGINNTALGYLALQNNTTGISNVAIGSNALAANTDGGQNTAIGYQALRLSGSGVRNVAIGTNALSSATTASSNVAIGYQAGQSLFTGTANVFIGHQAGLNDPDGFATTPTVSNSGAIGPRAQVQASNSIVIGDTDSNQPKVGIGSTIPLNMFSVSPVYYSTAGNAAGTATQSTNTITAVGATFTNAMIGMQVIFADGTNGGTITGTTATTLTVTTSQTVSPAQAFRIHVAGFQTTTNGTSFVQASSSTAFSVQTAAGVKGFTVDTSTNGTTNVVLGTASSNVGVLQFANAGGANLVSLQAGSASAAYALTLPTVAPSTGQCLQSGAVTATLLTFGSCAGGGGGLAKNAVDTSSFAVTATNNLYTFTNSSSATASGVLKLDNGNNTSPALTINGSTEQTGNTASPLVNTGLIQNYCKNSEEFEQASWTATGTVTHTTANANTTLAPDLEYLGLASQQTGDTIVSGATINSTLYCSSTNSLVGGSSFHTFSIWLRSSSGTPTVQLRIDDQSGAPAGTAKSVTLSTAWQRYFVTQDTSTFTTGTRGVINFPTANTTVIAWGAQVSYGAQAGPYVHIQANDVTITNSQIGLATNGLYVQGTTRADGQPSPSPLSVQGGNGFNTAGVTGNAAGAINVTGGAGGTAAGNAGTGGAGAAVTIQGGNGGAQSGTGATTGGTAGAISIFAGAGASGATGSAGATVTLRGGAGGNGTTTNGAGGSVIALVGVPGAGAGAAGAVGSFIVRPNGATGNGLNFQVQNNASAAVITGDTSTRTLTVTGTTGQTTAAQLVVTGSSYAHSASETGSVATLAVTDATITAGSPVTNGLSISSTVNVTTGASGTKTISSLNVAAPTLTACTGGTNACIWNGAKIATQSTGAAASITQNGISIAPVGISAGTLNGILIGNITSGASTTESGITIGQGYDVGLRIQAQGSLTQSAAATGALIDFGGSFTPSNAAGFANTGLKVTSPISFAYTTGATTFTGLDIGNSGTTASTTGGSFAFTGVNLVVPNVSLTTTNASGVGLAINTGSITQTSGTASMTGIDITLNTVSGTAVSTGLRIKGSGTVPTTGTTERLIDVQDSSSNNLLEVRDMSNANNNFGAAATTGAFISRNSYQDLEFNKFIASVTDNAAGATTNTNARRGDNNELATSTTTVGTTTGCTYAPVTNGLGGQEIITAASGAGTSDACAELATTATAGTIQKNYASNNLPVITMKVRPSAAPTANSNSRMFFGLADNAASSLAVPTNGIFFTNCTAVTPTCTSAKWIGMVVTAGTATTVTCNAAALENTAGNINFTSFNYLRIEVRANNDIHFFVDTDVSTGIVETECGTGVSAAGPGATALGPYLSVNVAATATTLSANIDYMRIWQDDAAGDPVDPSNLQGQQSSQNASSQITQSAATLAKPYDATAGGDLTEAYPVDDSTSFAPGDVVSIDARGGAKARRSDKPYDNNLLGVISSSPNLTLGSTTEKTVSVGVAGRVPVKVSTENGPIAPGDLLTASSTPGVAMRATKAGATIGQALDGFASTGEGKVLVRLNVSGHKASVDASDLQAGPVDQATIGNLKVTGDMVVEGVALFRGKVTVAADLAVAGHISVGEDVAGTAVIPVGKNSVYVKFAKPYAQVPVVTTSSDDFVAVRVINKTVNGFTIEAQSPVVREIKLDWTALEPPKVTSSP